MSKELRAVFRKTILHGIHSTDMALHFDKIKELEARDASKVIDFAKVDAFFVWIFAVFIFSSHILLFFRYVCDIQSHS
jgi:hypothetical protein